MTINEIKQATESVEALYFLSKGIKIKNYLNGKHKVLERKDFTFKNEVLKTSKITLQTVKTIIDFHASYLVGNPITLSGDSEVVALFNSVYKRGNFDLIDYKIVDNLIKFGNAFEYLYNQNGVIKSKVIDNLDAYPIYDDKGNYTTFIEHWNDSVTHKSYYVVYEQDTVSEYISEPNGNLVLIASYYNSSGLPIHYTSGSESLYSTYGEGIVEDLIPIIDEIEHLLSKTSDAVTTLSLNPLGVSSGQRIDSSVDKDLIGATLNLEDGGTFSFANATIDSATVSMLLNELINQLYAVASVPSVVFNGNISNVSEVSLKLLFTQLDNRAKRTSKYLKLGFTQRFEAIYALLKEKPSKQSLDSLNVVFNYNRPTDNSGIITDLCKQFEAGALSKQSFIEQSPYTENAEIELARINAELDTANQNIT